MQFLQKARALVIAVEGDSKITLLLSTINLINAGAWTWAEWKDSEQQRV